MKLKLKHSTKKRTYIPGKFSGSVALKRITPVIVYMVVRGYMVQVKSMQTESVFGSHDYKARLQVSGTVAEERMLTDCTHSGEEVSIVVVHHSDTVEQNTQVCKAIVSHVNATFTGTGAQMMVVCDILTRDNI